MLPMFEAMRSIQQVQHRRCYEIKCGYAECESLYSQPLPFHPLPLSLPSPTLEVGPLNPARGSGGAL